MRVEVLSMFCMRCKGEVGMVPEWKTTCTCEKALLYTTGETPVLPEHGILRTEFEQWFDLLLSRGTQSCFQRDVLREQKENLFKEYIRQDGLL